MERDENHYRSFVQVYEYNILSRRKHVFLRLRTGLLQLKRKTHVQNILFIKLGFQKWQRKALENGFFINY